MLNVCACVCVRVCMRVHTRACMHAYVYIPIINKMQNLKRTWGILDYYEAITQNKDK